MRVTHPFHPLNGQQFVCVGQRHGRYGSWLLLEISDDEVRAVRPQWTDFAVPDPELILGEGRSYFRVDDLVQLADLIDGLHHTRSPKTDSKV